MQIQFAYKSAVMSLLTDSKNINVPADFFIFIL